MTDRELLELAAKAAGIEIHPHLGPGEWVGGMNDKKYFNSWDPLTDDGHALRLAVKLRITSGIYDDGNEAFASWWHKAPDEEPWDNDRQLSEPLGDNQYAATRRVIVRAATEIGRDMV